MSTAPLEAGSPSIRSAPRPLGRLLAPLLFVELFSGILQLYFVPLYPTLAVKYDVSVATLSWALIGFTLAGAIATPLFSKLGDVYGHRRILRIEIGLVALGSVVIAAAPTFSTLLVGRVLQGTFPAFLPLMFGIVRDRHDADTTKRAVAYLSSVLLLGTTVGAVATSQLVLLSNGPQWVLWLPAVGTVIGFFAVGSGRSDGFVRRAGVEIDWAGLLLLAIGLAGLLLGLDEGHTWGWTSTRILASLAVGVVALIAFAAVELRVSQPVADLRFLFRPRILPVYLVGIAVYFGVIGGQVANATYMALPRSELGFGLGLAASKIALMFLPILGVAALLAFLTAPLGRRIGFAWVMALGASCAACGAGGLVLWHATLPEYLVFSVLGGAGLGFIEGSTRAVVVGQLRTGEVSMGQGIYELSTVVGGALGGAVLGGLMSAHLLGGKVPSEHAFVLVWGVTCAVEAVAAIVAVAYARRARA